MNIPGADPGFQVRGAHLKKLRRAEGGAKIFGVFRVKNHDFTPKNHNFSNFRGGGPVYHRHAFKHSYNDGYIFIKWIWPRGLYGSPFC